MLNRILFVKFLTATLTFASIGSVFAENAEIKTFARGGKISAQTVELAESPHAGFLRLKIPASSLGEIDKVEVRADFFSAKVGDDGYIVLSDGKLCTFAKKKSASLTDLRPVMPICGIKRADTAYLAVVGGMQFDFTNTITLKNGVYELCHTFDLSRGAPYEDIIIDYKKLVGRNANYSGIGRAYRAFKLQTTPELKPLRERAAKSPELAYAARSAEVRLRQGWKPAPSPVMDQTLQNEPPMYAKIPFEKVGEIVDAVKARGIDNVQVCLVGWNRMGHDGRYPQIFPVEEKLGGEKQLRALIEKTQRAGFQIVGHTNPTSCYPVSELWDESFIAKTKDGKLWERPIKEPWSGGRSFYMCMQTAYERFAVSDFPKMRKLGFRGLEYLDVVSIVPPQICYDTRHYTNAAKSALYCKKLMKLARENFGGAQSEGGFDHVAEYNDFALYTGIGLFKKTRLVDRVVPLWQIVYHGITLSNPSSDTVNYPVKDARTALKVFEFGGRPTLYVYSAFFEKGKKANWMGDADLRCGDKREFDTLIDAVATAAADARKFAELQFEFLESHDEIAPDVFMCVYSDGTQAVFNYSAAKFAHRGKEIAPLSYALFPSKK